MNDLFINPKLKLANFDTFFHRKSLFVSLNSNLKHLNGKLLDVGCGKMPYRSYISENSNISEYIGLEIYQALDYKGKFKPDFFWDGITMPFEDNSFDCVLLTEVLEHCFDPNITLSEVFRVLKKGGVVYFTVPFIWSLHEVPYDFHRYTPFSLTKYFENNNFSRIQLNSLGGHHASMVQMTMLWTQRAFGRKFIRRMLAIFLWPFVMILMRLDKKPMHFNNGQMITGISGIAFKM